MKHYELLCIIPAKYTEAELPGVEGKIADLIKKYEGEITSTQNLGNKRISYPIKAAQNGFYFVIELNLEENRVKDFENALKLTPEVLRHQLSSKKLKTQAEIEKEKLRQERIDQRLAEKKAEETVALTEDKIEEEKEQPIKQPKVSLEELDKKLGEILDGDII
jgi:small subunit ribosomal protein S6